MSDLSKALQIVIVDRLLNKTDAVRFERAAELNGREGTVGAICIYSNPDIFSEALAQ